MADFGALWKGATTLAGVALRTFARTVAGMVLLGIVLAGVSYYLAAQASVFRGILAAFVALAVCTVAGFVVAGQRAVAVALLRGLHEYRLGEGLLRLLFERLLGVSDEQAHGQRGGIVAKAAERVPLAQAETRLTDAATALLRTPAAGGGLTGWLRRKVQGRLLRAVERVTLAEFREQGAAHGGVDLVKVQHDLGQRIDGLVADRVGGGAVTMTILALVLAILTAVGVALALQQTARAGEAPSFPDRTRLLVYRDAAGRERPATTSANGTW